MGMENGLSASDVALLGDRNNFGDGSYIWILALLFLFMGGNGTFGNNQGIVSEADLCNANSFSELKNTVGRMNDQMSNYFHDTTKGICDLGYATLGNFNNLEKQLAECCCTTQRGIDNVNYNMSQSTAAINANTTAQTQKILDALAQNKIESMQNQINALQLDKAFCNVPKVNPYGYYIAPYPHCGCTNV